MSYRKCHIFSKIRTEDPECEALTYTYTYISQKNAMARENFNYKKFMK